MNDLGWVLQRRTRPQELLSADADPWFTGMARNRGVTRALDRLIDSVNGKSRMDQSRELRAKSQELHLRLGRQLDLAIRHVHAVLDGLAAVLFAELVGLLLHERTETLERPGDVFPGFLLGITQRDKQLFNLLALRPRIGAVDHDGSSRCLVVGMAQAINFVRRRVVFLESHSRNRKQRVLGAAVSFFANAPLLAPQIAVNCIALRDRVITETLRKTHVGAVGELAQQGQHLPLQIRGRFLLRIAEKYLVLNLQQPQLRLQPGQFLIYSHERPNWKSRRDCPAKRGTGRTQKGWNESKEAALGSRLYVLGIRF